MKRLFIFSALLCSLQSVKAQDSTSNSNSNYKISHLSVLLHATNGNHEANETDMLRDIIIDNNTIDWDNLNDNSFGYYWYWRNSYYNNTGMTARIHLSKSIGSNSKYGTSWIVGATYNPLLNFSSRHYNSEWDGDTVTTTEHNFEVVYRQLQLNVTKTYSRDFIKGFLTVNSGIGLDLGYNFINSAELDLTVTKDTSSTGYLSFFSTTGTLTNTVTNYEINNSWHGQISIPLSLHFNLHPNFSLIADARFSMGTRKIIGGNNYHFTQSRFGIGTLLKF